MKNIPDNYTRLTNKAMAHDIFTVNKHIYHDLFGEYYDVWKQTHTCIQQVSMPRSGSTWTWRLIAKLSNTQTFHNLLYTNEDDTMEYPNDAYFIGHYFRRDYRADKYVFLIRDPRTVAYSLIGFFNKNNIPNRIGDMDYWHGVADMYRKYFDRYLSRNTILVQYEKLCLFPEREFRRILKFIGYNIVNDISTVIKEDDVGSGFAFGSAGEKYKHFCFKWQNDPDVMNPISELLWSDLSDIMIHYGYTESGHSQLLLNG